MDLLKGLAQTLQHAVQSNTPGAFAQAGSELVQLQNRIRERFQELTAGEISGIISKLEDNEPLTQAEQDFVRTWMVGDAESYTRLENNFKDWEAEFARLLAVIQSYEVKAETVPHLLNVHGLLRDAMRVAADISNYLEEKDRLERFEAAMKSLSQADARLMAQLLRAKLETSEM